MNIRLSNQLHSVDACLALAHSKDHVGTWTGQEPVAFTTYLAVLQSDYSTVMAKAALAESAGGGAADAKAVAESTLENCAYVLARALALHFKKSKDFTRHAQVDVSRSDIVRLRENDLVSKTTAIRDIAAAVLTERGASSHGVTVERTEALASAIGTFKTAMAMPRGQIVNRATVLRELETDTAALMEQLSDLDDLVLQFDGSPAGERFIAAWKRARTIIDRVAEMPAKATHAPEPAMAG